MTSDKSIPILETPRLLLRPWEDDDVDAWAEMAADERVTRYLFRVRTGEEAKAYATGKRRNLERDGFGWWVAEIKGGLRFAGLIALQDVPFDAYFTPAKELGWFLRPEVWGNGYATEGARAVLDFARTTLGWPEIVAMTASLNLPSQRVMQRLGMTHDSEFDHPLIPEGHPLRKNVLYRSAARKRID